MRIEGFRNKGETLGRPGSIGQGSEDAGGGVWLDEAEYPEEIVAQAAKEGAKVTAVRLVREVAGGMVFEVESRALEGVDKAKEAEEETWKEVKGRRTMKRDAQRKKIEALLHVLVLLVYTLPRTAPHPTAR